MSDFIRNEPRHAPRRAGFTLVEMLVATALVVLIMLMFAQVFGMATNAMSRQRGMAELDQGARTITTVLTNDLHNRTFREVQPFWPGQNTASLPLGYDITRRRGYFYISENDPRLHTDDILQLTVDVNSNFVRGTPFARGDSNARRDPSRRDPLLYGKTVQLAEPRPIDPRPSPTTPDNPAFIDNMNQPDFDDGHFPVQLSPGNYVGTLDGMGASQFAEVSYFLRNGNLYRRALLIRQRYDVSIGADQPEGILGPYDATDTPAGGTYSGSGQFWRDFDYSAWFDDGATPAPTVSFNVGPSVLDNVTGQATTSAGVPLSLGVPHLRFGHTVYRNTVGAPVNALPREFLNYADPADPTDWPFVAAGSPPNASNFVGRFTVNECSHDNFGYPGRIHVNPAGGARENPMDPETPLTFDSQHQVSQYVNSERRGDDLLMSNVHTFDIKVWDDVLQRYMDLGHDENDGAGNPGRFHRDNNQNNPITGGNYGNRFDTWNPNLGDPPPYYTTTLPLPPGAPPAVAGVEEVPLRGIRITIRYQDVSTGAMRTVVREFSLVDPGQ